MDWKSSIIIWSFARIIFLCKNQSANDNLHLLVDHVRFSWLIEFSWIEDFLHKSEIWSSDFSLLWLFLAALHCAKSVRIRSYSGPNAEKCGPE